MALYFIRSEIKTEKANSDVPVKITKSGFYEIHPPLQDEEDYELAVGMVAERYDKENEGKECLSVEIISMGLIFQLRR